MILGFKNGHYRGNSAYSTARANVDVTLHSRRFGGSLYVVLTLFGHGRPSDMHGERFLPLLADCFCVPIGPRDKADRQRLRFTASRQRVILGKQATHTYMLTPTIHLTSSILKDILSAPGARVTSNAHIILAKAIQTELAARYRAGQARRPNPKDQCPSTRDGSFVMSFASLW
jgi:hypothetical protein